MSSSCTWSGALSGENSMISFSIAAKSWKHCWNSSARDDMSAAYLLICALILFPGKLVIISSSDGKYVVLGCVCDRCLWKSCSLFPKAYICEYSWLTTAFCPWRLVFSMFRCHVMSTKNPISASRAGLNSSGIGLSLFCQELSDFFLREKKYWSADLWLRHLTSLWYTSPYSAWM